ncbi:MAG: carboxypeptidase regulatory-like domain-containing protein, partial [Terriglobales bacterium]
MSRYLPGFVMGLGLFCVVLSLIPNAGAQATTGSIVGRVTDPSKAVVVGAQISALNQATGISYTTQSNQAGDFVVQRVPPGIYTVTVTQQGFETAVAKDLELVIDQKLAIDFELKIGIASTVETVTSQAPLLQTESVETGAVIGSQQILDLPLLGRNFLQLSLLTPGVVNGEGGNTLNLSVNGQREFANSVVIDGVEATGNRNNDTNLRPSVDAVEEFKVATSDYSAEFGRAGGGVISIQTKAGTNKFHGDAYEFYRPNATAAENYSFSGPGQSPNLSQHNFGATFGGPIVKDKTFFFISYEQERLRNTITYLDAVPPQNQVVFNPDGSVDLSGLVDPGIGLQLPIFDP